MFEENNLYDSGGLVSGKFDIGAIDYTSNSAPVYATADQYPTSAIDSGSGGGLSSSWETLFQGSIAKGLDYFMQKDAYQTRMESPYGSTYQQRYIRGADGRLYNQQGMPIASAQVSAGGNPMLLLLLLGGFLLLRKG